MVDKLNSTDVFVGGLENIDGDLHASGAVNQAELVELTATENQVQQISTDGDAGYGVAMYGVADGEALAVSGPGAMVRVKASEDNDPSHGDLLTGNSSVNGVDTAVSGDEVIGVARSNQAGGEIVMLQTGPGGDAN